MEKRKSRAVVFVPVAQWVFITLLFCVGLFSRMEGACLAARVLRGPEELEQGQRFIREFFTSWGDVQGILLGMCIFACGVAAPPVLIMGRKSLWLVRLFGLYWKRVRGRDLGAVVMMSRSLILKDHEGWIDEVSSFSMRRNRRIAEALHERFGVEIKPHRP